MFQHVSDDACVELEDELEIITQQYVEQRKEQRGRLPISACGPKVTHPYSILAADLEQRSKPKPPPEPSNAPFDFFGRALLTLSRSVPEW